MSRAFSSTCTSSSKMCSAMLLFGEEVEEVRIDRRDVGGHPDAEIRRARRPEREQGGAEGEAEMIEAHRRGMGGSRNAPADCNRRSRAG